MGTNLVITIIDKMKITITSLMLKFHVVFKTEEKLFPLLLKLIYILKILQQINPLKNPYFINTQNKF